MKKIFTYEEYSVLKLENKDIPINCYVGKIIDNKILEILFSYKNINKETILTDEQFDILLNGSINSKFIETHKYLFNNEDIKILLLMYQNISSYFSANNINLFSKRNKFQMYI